MALVGEDTGGVSMAALASGRLVEVGQCLMLDAGGGSLQLLVLEHGTTSTEDGAALVTPDGVVVTPGDGISAAGGFSSVAESGAQDSWPSAPEDCWAVEEVAFVTDGLEVDPSVVQDQLVAWGVVEEHGDGTLLLVPGAQPTAAMEALTHGALTRLQGGCLGLAGAGGSQLVRWPYGTTWDLEEEAPTLPEQGLVRLGDELSLGGGEGLVEWLEPALPRECAYDSVWVAASPPG